MCYFKYKTDLLIVKPRYSWNTAKVGVKHQSINQSIWLSTFQKDPRASFFVITVKKVDIQVTITT
jgi:hypothetical protein